MKYEGPRAAALCRRHPGRGRGWALLVRRGARGGVRPGVDLRVMATWSVQSSRVPGARAATRPMSPAPAACRHEAGDSVETAVAT